MTVFTCHLKGTFVLVCRVFVPRYTFSFLDYNLSLMYLVHLQNLTQFNTVKT